MAAKSVFDKIGIIELDITNGNRVNFEEVKEEINILDDDIGALAQALKFLTVRVGNKEKETLERIAGELEAIQGRLY